MIKGCKNQAWDMSHIMNLGQLHAHEDKYKEDFIFAKNDKLLKMVYINAHAPSGIEGILKNILSKNLKTLQPTID